MADTTTRRITIQYAPRRWAEAFHASFQRWLVMILHRRAGKTTAIINHHQRAALNDDWETRRLQALVPTLTDQQLDELLHPPGGRHYGHVMPLRNQAKLTIWDALKYYAAAVPGVQFNEADLMVRYPNGHKLQLFGADNPDALRGPGFSGLSFDEYSQHPPNLFGEVLSKSLADHLGYAIFAGTIKGKDQLYRMHDVARRDPAWFALWQDADVSLATEDDATIALLRQAMTDDRNLIAKGLMTQAEYDQEWFLSPEAAIKGAWFGAEMAAALKAGRICTVPHDPALPVDTDWDLGVDDATAIWFSQSLRSGEVRLIDYYEASGEGLPHYAHVLRDRGYVYGKHWGPHDIRVRELGTGKTRQATAAALGMKFDVVPDIGLADGINAVRLMLPRCWFDEDQCARGLEALRQYRKRLNPQLGEFTGTPVHDQWSHGADAFRGLAVRHRTPEAPKPPQDELSYRMPGEFGWMSA